MALFPNSRLPYWKLHLGKLAGLPPSGASEHFPGFTTEENPNAHPNSLTGPGASTDRNGPVDRGVWRFAFRLWSARSGQCEEDPRNRKDLLKKGRDFLVRAIPETNHTFRLTWKACLMGGLSLGGGAYLSALTERETARNWLRENPVPDSVLGLALQSCGLHAVTDGKTENEFLKAVSRGTSLEVDLWSGNQTGSNGIFVSAVTVAKRPGSLPRVWTLSPTSDTKRTLPTLEWEPLGKGWQALQTLVTKCESPRHRPAPPPLKKGSPLIREPQTLPYPKDPREIEVAR